MIVLGLNAYHGDASACIFKNDVILVAAEKERFTRVKHAAGFPINAIKFCLITKMDILVIGDYVLYR
tara:strand:+ start:160 stop:360 length:201 start_codon:yes stop_codon:yes gene_type:complete